METCINYNRKHFVLTRFLCLESEVEWAISNSDYVSHVLRVWTWNIGSVSGNGKVFGELRKRMIDVCCLQKVK